MELDKSFSQFEAVMIKEPIQNLNKTVGYLQYTKKVAHLCRIIEKTSFSLFFQILKTLRTQGGAVDRANWFDVLQKNNINLKRKLKTERKYQAALDLPCFR